MEPALGGGTYSVNQKLLLDFRQVTVGENETNVVLDEASECVNLRVGLSVLTEDLPDHGVLAHQHLTRSTEGLADPLHLIRSHIVSTDNDDLGVFVQVRL